MAALALVKIDYERAIKSLEAARTRLVLLWGGEKAGFGKANGSLALDSAILPFEKIRLEIEKTRT
jgi:hypothetical protein